MKTIIRNHINSLLPLYKTHQEAESVIWWMLNAITGKTKLELLLGHQILSIEQQASLEQWIFEHTIHKKPLAYLIGSVPFIDCTIVVEPPLLIPRPETEEWVAHLIKKLQQLPNKKISILDLCTGTGAIACALAKALPEAMVVAADISEVAVEVTKKNAKANGVSITCIKSDLFSALSGMQFDLIVTNPPYISADVWQTLDPMVKDWEDYNALVASDNGLGIIHEICRQAPKYLIENPTMQELEIAQLYCEIGYDQGKSVSHLMDDNFSQVIVLQDYNKKDRVVCGSLP